MVSAKRRIPDAFLTGKTWDIPETDSKPEQLNKYNVKLFRKGYG